MTRGGNPYAEALVRAGKIPAPMGVLVEVETTFGADREVIPGIRHAPFFGGVDIARDALPRIDASGTPSGNENVKRNASEASDRQADPTDLGLSAPTGPAKFPGDPRKATIREGQDFVQAQRNRGAECPCCKQYARAWRRPLLSVSVADLIRLVKLQKAAPAKGRAGDFFHVTEFSKQRNGNFALLALWGLIVEEENGNKRKRKSGRWRATGDGVAFAMGDLTVPRYLVTFDRRLLAYGEKRVGVRAALRNRFDYEALMRGDV